MQLADLQDACGKAIDLEIEAVRRDLEEKGADAPVAVRDLLRTGSDTDGFEYACTGPTGRTIAEHTPLQLLTEGARFRGHLLAYDPVSGEIRFVISDDAGSGMDQGQLEFDPTFLLTALKDALLRLKATDPGVSLAIRALLGIRASGDGPHAPPADPRLNDSQNRAVHVAREGDVTHLWGPPGTGKTHTLASLLGTFIAGSEQAIVCAPTNVAVDNLARALLQRGGRDLEEALDRGLVVRVGEVAPDLRNSRLHIDHAFEQTCLSDFPEMVEEISRLWSEAVRVLGRGRREITDPLRARPRFYLARRLAVRAAGAGTPGAADLAEACDKLAQRVSAVEKAAVQRATLVFCTLTKLSLGGVLEGLRHPAVVIDEASMVPLPAMLVGSCRGTLRVVTAGDFQQLPPVFLSDRYEVIQWYGRNVYEMAKIDDPARELSVRPLLDEQYRMHPEISRLVSTTFYAGRLRDAPAVREGAAQGSRLFLVDTEELAPVSERPEGGSRINPSHAGLVRGLVEDIRQAGWTDIGVITPYAAQARLIRAALKEVWGSVPQGVEISTVHRFQGREKRVVVVDLADGPPIPVHFLNDSRNRSAPKLVNVALSRAQDVLIVVAHGGYMERTLSRQASVSKVLAWIRTHGLELGPGEWSPDLLR